MKTTALSPFLGDNRIFNGRRVNNMKNPVKETLLIVDNDGSLRHHCQAALEARGYRCIPAKTSAEVQKLCLSHQVDLVLCHIQKPDESWLELIRRVNKTHPDTAVVIVAGTGDMETALPVYGDYISACLSEPVAAHQIPLSIANALKDRKQWMNAKAYCEDLENAVRKSTNTLMKIKQKLKARETEIEALKHELKTVENAMGHIMNRHQSEKKALQENIHANLRKTVFPHVERLRYRKLTDSQRRDLEIIRTNLKDLVSPHLRDLTSVHNDLTPMEIEVANLIRQGKSTKEIAGILHLSSNTIMSHRYKIRTKLGLKQQKQNLRTYLNTLKTSDITSLISY